MAKSIETNSTMSSISGKATTLKKSVQNCAKTVARPFKKLKKSISTTSTHSIRSRRSSITTSIPDNENVNRDEESSIDGHSNGDRTKPEVKLTPQEELSMPFIIILSFILIKSMSEALQEHWRSPIYTF